jgi:hypothetical protein
LKSQVLVDPASLPPAARGLGNTTPMNSGATTPSRGTIDNGRGGSGIDSKESKEAARLARKESTIALNVAVKGADKAAKGVKEGYLRKVGGRVKNVKRRYFRLFASTFEYYKGPNVRPHNTYSLLLY